MESSYLIMGALVAGLVIVAVVVMLFLKRQDKEEEISTDAEELERIEAELKKKEEQAKSKEKEEKEAETPAPQTEPEKQAEKPAEEPLVKEAVEAKPDAAADVFARESEEEKKESSFQEFGSIFSEDGVAVPKLEEDLPETPEMIFETGTQEEILHGSSSAIFDQSSSLTTPVKEEKEETVKPVDIFQDESTRPGVVLEETKVPEPESIFKESPEPTPGDIFAGSAPIPPDAPSEQDIESILEQVVEPLPVEDETPPPPTPKPKKKRKKIELDPEDVKRHEKAKRIARVIINDIRNYNPDKLAEGIRQGNILKTLGVEIERGRQLYIKRVPPDIAKITNYYRENLIKLLADGRPELFGWK